jgi:hypothetical protein
MERFARWDNTWRDTRTRIYTLLFFFFTGATDLCGSWPPPWFRNSKIFRGGVVSTAPNLQPGRPGTIVRLVPTLRSVWHWLAVPEVYAPAIIALRVIGARKLPLHDKAVVLEENTLLTMQLLWDPGAHNEYEKLIWSYKNNLVYIEIRTSPRFTVHTYRIQFRQPKFQDP